MNVISVIIYAAELAVAAIILFYVVEMLTMPVNMKRAGMCFCSGGALRNEPGCNAFLKLLRRRRIERKQVRK
jgi:hypothetical protein